MTEEEIRVLYQLFKGLSTDKKLNVIFCLLSSETIATVGSTLGVKAIIKEVGLE